MKIKKRKQPYPGIKNYLTISGSNALPTSKTLLKLTEFK